VNVLPVLSIRVGHGTLPRIFETYVETQLVPTLEKMRCRHPGQFVGS
jgi:hypothetical protein